MVVEAPKLQYGWLQRMVRKGTAIKCTTISRSHLNRVRDFAQGRQERKRCARLVPQYGVVRPEEQSWLSTQRGLNGDSMQAKARCCALGPQNELHRVEAADVDRIDAVRIPCLSAVDQHPC